MYSLVHLLFTMWEDPSSSPRAPHGSIYMREASLMEQCCGVCSPGVEKLCRPRDMVRNLVANTQIIFAFNIKDLVPSCELFFLLDFIFSLF